MDPLVPLPAATDFAPPTLSWPHAALTTAVGRRVDDLVGRLVAAPERVGTTHALVVVQHGCLVLQRYGAGIDADSTLHSWSMAKSILHAAAGIAGVDPADRIGLPDLSHAPTATWDHLLRMTSGLAWDETYPDGEDDTAEDSDVVRMLFGDGANDVAAYAAARPAASPPGEVFLYSSGTTNLVSRGLSRDLARDGRNVDEFLRTELFEPIGMTTATPKFDARGTWKASSYCFATALDFARFGLLYLRDGLWGDRRVLPAGWVDHARTLTPESEGVENHAYGAHWWLGDDSHGTFFASGYEGQYLAVCPAADAVVVRLGRSDEQQRDNCWHDITELLDLLV